MMKTSILFTAILVSVSSLFSAKIETLRPTTYQGSINQRNLMKETQELRSELLAIMDDLRRNGFPESALADIQLILNRLESVTSEDMQTIAQLLLNASQAGVADEVVDNAAAAYTSQQLLEEKLKSIARTMAIRHLREDVERQIERIITNQLSIRGRVARTVQTGTTLEETRKSLITADQRSVTTDLQTMLNTGDNLMVRLTGDENAPREGERFSDRINGQRLIGFSNGALSSIESDEYANAVRQQDSLLLELRRLLLSLQSSKSKSQRLSTALLEAKALQEEQKALAEEIKEKGEMTEEMKEKQEELINTANILNASIAQLEPEAAQELAEATEKMRESARDENQNEENNKAEEAAKELENAVASLEKSLDEAREEEAAKAEATNKALENSMAALDEAEAALNPDAEKSESDESESDESDPTKTETAQDQQDSESDSSKDPTSEDSSPQSNEDAMAQKDQAGENKEGEDNEDSEDNLEKASKALSKALDETKKAAEANKSSDSEQSPELDNALKQAENALEAAKDAADKGDKEKAQENISEARKALTDAQQQLGVNQRNDQLADQQETDQSTPTEDGPAGHGGEQGAIAGKGTGPEGEINTVGALEESEREALNTLQSEAYPAEYEAWIQQYWRNLTETPDER